MEKIGKLSSDEDSEEAGRVCFNEKLRLISISGAINWQLADEFFNILTGFESLKSRKLIIIYINSNGGDAYSMFKIYDHIKNSPLFIVTVIAGRASSAGFMIFLAGDYRIMFPNAFLGFHAPTVYYSSNCSEGPDEARESASHQNHILDAMIKIVAKNSNMTEKMARKYFSVLTRIDADTALKFGLAHEVMNPPKKVFPKLRRKS